MALAFAVIAGDPFLFAYWPGHAVQITLATLVVQALNGFPLNKTGPIAALLLVSLAFTVAIFGTGSVAGTLMTEQAAAVPLLGGPWTLALGLLLALSVVAWRKKRPLVDKAGP